MALTARKAQVVVFLKNEQGEIFLLRLRTNLGRGHFWQNVTGSVEDGEDFHLGARRELFEETAISDEVFPIDYEITFHDRWGKDVTEKCYYTITAIKEVKLDPSEHEAFEWKKANEVVASDFEFETNYIAFQKAYECIK